MRWPGRADNFVARGADLDTDEADKAVKTNAKRKPWRTPLVMTPTPVDETEETPPPGGADLFGSTS